MILPVGADRQGRIKDNATRFRAEKAGVACPAVNQARSPWDSGALMLAPIPSSLDCHQPMGSVTGELNRASKSKALRVYLRKY
jgi:hypothetical protein